MSKLKIAAVLVVVLGSLALLWPVWNRHKSDRAQTIRHSWAMAKELAAGTNCPHLVFPGSIFQKRLAQFLTAPARVEAVCYGDEPPPGTVEKATSRVYLVNEKGERLALRLKQESSPTQFRMLGWWVPTSAPPPADN